MLAVLLIFTPVLFTTMLLVTNVIATLVSPMPCKITPSTKCLVYPEIFCLASSFILADIDGCSVLESAITVFASNVAISVVIVHRTRSSLPYSSFCASSLIVGCLPTHWQRAARFT